MSLAVKSPALSFLVLFERTSNSVRDLGATMSSKLIRETFANGNMHIRELIAELLEPRDDLWGWAKLG